jgi:hypothetical protein
MPSDRPFPSNHCIHGGEVVLGHGGDTLSKLGGLSKVHIFSTMFYIYYVVSLLFLTRKHVLIDEREIVDCFLLIQVTRYELN